MPRLRRHHDLVDALAGAELAGEQLPLQDVVRPARAGCGRRIRSASSVLVLLPRASHRRPVAHTTAHDHRRGPACASRATSGRSRAPRAGPRPSRSRPRAIAASPSVAAWASSRRATIVIVRHSPQSRAGEPAQVADVDRVVVMVGERQVDEQRRHVAEVLVVGLHHLQLHQQQVGERERVAPGIASRGSRSISWHSSTRSRKTSSWRPVGGVEEEQPAVAVERVEALVGDVPRAGQQLRDPRPGRRRAPRRRRPCRSGSSGGDAALTHRSATPTPPTSRSSSPVSSAARAIRAPSATGSAWGATTTVVTRHPQRLAPSARAGSRSAPRCRWR